MRAGLQRVLQNSRQVITCRAASERVFLPEMVARSLTVAAPYAMFIGSETASSDPSDSVLSALAGWVWRAVFT